VVPVQLGDVDDGDGLADIGNRVEKRAAVLREPGRVHDDGIDVHALVQPVDQLTFAIRLDVLQFHAEPGREPVEPGRHVGQGLRAVALGPAYAEPVQVRALDNRDLHCVVRFHSELGISRPSHCGLSWSGARNSA
jgi:hypothetical protein